MSLRTRRRERTREEIRQAALELFERQGFAETTVEQIAEAAEVGRRTFFRYFPTKQSVLLADFDAKAAELAEAFAAQPADLHPVRAAVAAIEGLVAVIDEHRSRHLMVADLLAREGVARFAVLEGFDTARRALTEAIAERLRVDPLADPRPGAWAGAVLGCFLAAYERWLAMDPAPPLSDLFRSAVGACAGAF